MLSRLALPFLLVVTIQFAFTQSGPRETGDTSTARERSLSPR
jgi:hypothetical protein